MTFTGGIVLFAIFWFLALYMILPLFVKSQDEVGEVEPGTPASAPDQPLMKKKLIWTTVGAVIAWLIAFAVMESGMITMADIIAIGGRPK